MNHAITPLSLSIKKTSLIRKKLLQMNVEIMRFKVRAGQTNPRKLSENAQ